MADETTINDNPENGPKTTEALAALDAAIAKVEAFQADDDEQDSSDIWVRVRELEKRLQGAPSHSPKDALTGLPVAADGGASLGPADPLAADPVVTPEESGQASSAPEGTTSLTDETR